MKGEINEGGGLLIERPGHGMVQMECPNRVAVDSTPSSEGRFYSTPFYCNHRCAAFREPKKDLLGGTFRGYKLQLCSKVGALMFVEFKDKRVEKNES